MRIHDGDARPLLEALPQASFERIYLLYPDPWPKARHNKRRFVSPENLAHFHRVLKPEGLFLFASDIDDYVAWTREHVAGMAASRRRAILAALRELDRDPLRGQGPARGQGIALSEVPARPAEDAVMPAKAGIAAAGDGKADTGRQSGTPAFAGVTPVQGRTATPCGLAPERTYIAANLGSLT